MLPNCTKQSILYKNICHRCVPGARADKKMKEEDLIKEQPVIYVGEMSRSLMERSKEHWASYRERNEDSHMLRHHDLVHKGEPAEFTMRMVGSHRSALSRQVAGGGEEQDIF